MCTFQAAIDRKTIYTDLHIETKTLERVRVPISAKSAILWL